MIHVLISKSENVSLMAHSNYTGHGQGQGLENDGFLYYTMYCTHYTGTWTETGNHWFLLGLSRLLSWSRVVCMSHYNTFITENAHYVHTYRNLKDTG